MTQVYFDEPYAVISWDEDSKFVYTKWDHPKNQEFQMALEKGLELFIDKGASKWLGDIRELGDLTWTGEAWEDVHFYPKAVRAGLKYMALISTEEQIARKGALSVTDDRFEGGEYTYHLFTNLEDAKSWLAGCE